MDFPFKTIQLLGTIGLPWYHHFRETLTSWWPSWLVFPVRFLVKFSVLHVPRTNLAIDYEPSSVIKCDYASWYVRSETKKHHSLRGWCIPIDDNSWSFCQLWCSYLVGGWATPLKNMKVNWDDIPNTWKKKVMFQSPPTSHLKPQLHLQVVDKSDVMSSTSHRGIQKSWPSWLSPLKTYTLWSWRTVCKLEAMAKFCI